MTADADSPTAGPLRIAVLTVSDTRDMPDDRSGDVLASHLAAHDHALIDRAIVTDDISRIRRVVFRWIANPHVDVILTTGGTGLTGRDVTPEALEPLFEKRITGFDALFHRISFDTIGTSTVQSRATAGVAGGTFIFALPGSPGACRDAWEAILQYQLDYRHKPCNFVEISARMNEHMRRGRHP